MRRTTKLNAALAHHLMLRAGTTHGVWPGSRSAGLCLSTVCRHSGEAGDLAPIHAVLAAPMCHHSDCAIVLLHGSQHRARVGCLQGGIVRLPGEAVGHAASFPGWIHNRATPKHAQWTARTLRGATGNLAAPPVDLGASAAPKSQPRRVCAGHLLCAHTDLRVSLPPLRGSSRSPLPVPGGCAVSLVFGKFR